MAKTPAVSSLQLLTVAEVAKIMDTSERTVRELVMMGRMPGTKMGKEYRVIRRDLEEYLAKAKARD